MSSLSKIGGSVPGVWADGYLVMTLFAFADVSYYLLLNHVFGCAESSVQRVQPSLYLYRSYIVNLDFTSTPCFLNQQTLLYR